MGLTINRATAVALGHVVLPFLGTLVAVWYAVTIGVDATDLWLLVGLHVVTFLGLTVGFHRYLVHRSFATNRVVEAVLLIAGCLAVSGTPLFWAASHVRHHARSDTVDDPHSPEQGFLHAQFGWLVKVDFHPDYERYGRSFLADDRVMLINRLYPVWILASLGIPLAIGGWSGLLFGGFARIFVTQHVGWLVNSVCHLIGRRPYETSDRSGNVWLLGLFAMGVGWHNNHHAFPRSAFHGLRWWQVDISGYLIRALERLGLATDVVRVPAEALAARRSV